jgi:hypothetical protein
MCSLLKTSSLGTLKSSFNAYPHSEHAPQSGINEGFRRCREKLNTVHQYHNFPQVVGFQVRVEALR